jgi:hypothetical protein
MTIAQHEGTGPVRVQAQTVPAIPFRVRRRLTFAVYGRQAKRRATWIRADRAQVTRELPILALVTTFAAALTIESAVMGLATLLVLR